MVALGPYYTPLQTWRLLDASYGAMAVAFTRMRDVDGDGTQDLIICGSVMPPGAAVPQPWRIASGDGQGNFALADTAVFPWDETFTISPSDIQFADFNGDGHPDAFVGTFGYDAPPFPGEQNRLFLSAPDGSLHDATETLPQIVDGTHSIAFGDIDLDGDLDIYVGNVYVSTHVSPYLLVNDGTGHFTVGQGLLPTAPGELLNLDTMKATASALADLNGDGYADLLLGNHGDFPDHLHSMVMWNQQGSFSATQVTELPLWSSLAPTSTALTIEAADINGDGLEDIVLFGTQGYEGWEVQLLVNRRAGPHADQLGRSFPESLHSMGVAERRLRPLHDHHVGDLADLVAGAGDFKYVFGEYYWTRLVETDEGWSFIDVRNIPSDGKLSVSVILASTPFPATASEPAEGSAPVTRTGGPASETLAGGGGALSVAEQGGTEGTDTLQDVEQLYFSDIIVLTTIAANARFIAPADLKLLEELYVGFFNRVPDAQGLNYWITQFRNGMTIDAIADAFYAAGVQFNLYPEGMGDAAFVREIYKNVLGRPPGVPPTDDEVQYWVDKLVSGQETKGTMVLQMLSDVHTYFEGITDPTHPNYPYLFVADHLNNKAAVADWIAVQQGIGYHTATESIAMGMAVAAAITPTDTSAAIALVGLVDSDFSFG